MKFPIMQLVFSTYSMASPGNRIRPAVRYALASFSGIASLIPETGKLLDVGCGDGLLAVYLGKVLKRTQPIVGVDIDERKIVVASALDLPHAAFHHKDVAAMPSNSFDIVSAVHVLYLVPRHLREQFIGHCVRVLKPSGTLVLAINMKTPWWKYCFSYLQELLMVKLLNLTAGQTVRFASIDECKGWITKAGATIATVIPLDQGRPYSHAGVVAYKLPSGSSLVSIGDTP